MNAARAAMRFGYGWWLLLFLGSAQAHELGVAQVEAAFYANGSYAIRVRVDLEHLSTGLGPDPSLNTRFQPRNPISDPITQRFGNFLRDYLTQSVIVFDWKQVPLSLDSVVLEQQPNPAGGPAKEFLVVMLQDRLPPDARKFVWSNGMRLGSYQLTLQQEGQPEPVRELLEARQESNPYLLQDGLAPASWKRRTLDALPYAAAVVLALVGLWLLRRRNP